MGAWGDLPFENDDALDWVNGLNRVSDLSYVQQTFAAVEESEMYLEAPLACAALAACEVLARLRGKSGYQNPSTKSVDQWVREHPQQPSDELLELATWVIKLILGPQSELRALFEEGNAKPWIESVKELRERLKA
jgi:hypothetical protein